MRELRVCFLITEDWYFWSHRRLLAQHLIEQGARVDLVTSLARHRRAIESAGIRCHPIGTPRLGRNPMAELSTVIRLARLLHRLQPDLVHLVGMKPILYGSCAAILARVPAIVCAVSGFGWLFTPGGMLKSASKRLVQTYFRQVLAGRRNVCLVVQNTSHQAMLIETRMGQSGQVFLIPGAGVDAGRFAFVDEPEGACTIVTHARMLWDKGIGDLVAAARLVKQTHPTVRFSLVGDPDPANPSSIPRDQLERWNAEGIVQWQGRRNDIPRVLAQSHIACLPSYHEGFPLSLVEAASCGRPIVTNNIAGCNSVVRHDDNGLLVDKGDVIGLANALTKLIQDPVRRRAMGQRGRSRVIHEMSSHVVNEQTCACYATLLSSRVEFSQHPDLRRKAA